MKNRNKNKGLNVQKVCMSEKQVQTSLPAQSRPSKKSLSDLRLQFSRQGVQTETNSYILEHQVYQKRQCLRLQQLQISV